VEDASRRNPNQRNRTAIVVPVLSLALIFNSALAQTPCPEYYPRHVLVRFQPAATAAAQQDAHAAAGAQVLEDFGDTVDGLQLVEVGELQQQAAIAIYNANPNVIYAEPDWYLYADIDPPNDPDFNPPIQRLWALENVGQELQEGFAIPCNAPEHPSGCSCPDPGTAGADIRARQAWDIWQGGESFRVAVLDTGVAYDHCDLKDNMWTNPCEDLDHDGVVDGSDRCFETPQIPNGDFDCQDSPCPCENPPCLGNGYIDDIVGYDFYANPNDPDPKDEPPFMGHGTSVAGIIAAQGNNAIGLVGVNWNARIVALRIGHVAGGGDVLHCGSAAFVSALFKAIRYCIKNDIRVTNRDT
jgi:subtilisin family serine protease